MADLRLEGIPMVEVFSLKTHRVHWLQPFVLIYGPLEQAIQRASLWARNQVRNRYIHSHLRFHHSRRHYHHSRLRYHLHCRHYG